MTKFVLYSFIVQSVFCSLALSHSSEAQVKKLKEIYLEVSFSQSSLEEAFNVIEQKTEFDFAYIAEDLPQNKVSLNFKKRNLEDILLSIAEQSGVSFKRVKTTIHVKNSTENQNKLEEILEVNTQTRNITGKVTSYEDGEGLPGVNVVEKGTSNGTVTDVQGNYSLEVSEGATLVFSSVGYTQEEVEVGNRSVINITMAEDIQQLEELVVIGYGTVRKSDLTGSVSKITSEEINQNIFTNVDQAMVGKLPGVEISLTNGEPGAGMSIRIRGSNSITANNEPLYVIDGIPIDNSPTVSLGGAAGQGDNPSPKNPLNTLNPNDIESIEILKDASATAIYGARGANGVVLVTTKRGRKGETRISYDGSATVSSASERYDVLNAKEYMNALNDISRDRGEDPIFSDAEIQSMGEGTDWQDEIYRTAFSQNHNLSISGGNESLNYYISGNYTDQQGLIENNSLRRYNLRTNFDSQLNDRLKLALNLNVSKIDDQAATTGIRARQTAGVVLASIMFDPTLPVTDENGDFTLSDFLLLPNPVSITRGVDNKIRTFRTSGNMILRYNILEGLSTSLNFGLDQQNVRRDVYTSRDNLQGMALGGIADILSLDRSNVVLEYTLNYQKTLNDKHEINALGGITYQEFVDRNHLSAISGFANDVLKTDNLNAGDGEQSVVNSNFNNYRILSYLGRINYSLLNKYLFTLSYRIDGSSRFGANNRYGSFPSAAIGWKLAEEAFVPELFSQLKLRASWGITGNQEVGNFAYLPTFTPVARGAVFNDREELVFEPSRIPNPDLKWEKTEQINFGLDVGIFEDRLSASFDYFVKNTDDLLLNLPLPISSGFTTQLRNVGGMKNSGFEVMITSRNITGGNLNWTTNVNLATLTNEVTNIGNLDRIITGIVPGTGGGSVTSSIIEPGLPLNAYYGYQVDGIFQNEDEIANSAQPDAQPGFPIIRDVNDDGVISDADRMVLGNPYPDLTLGINNSFTYKNFGLDVFFNGKFGNDLLNATEQRFAYPSNFRRNRSARQIKDRWTPENPDAKWPSATFPNSYAPGEVLSLFIEDASFFRLRTVRIRYDFAGQRIGLFKKATVYLTGENIFTLTNYSGVNPEANSFPEGNVRIGFASYPLPRSFMLGLNLQF